jgi:hypothetical protein
MTGFKVLRLWWFDRPAVGMAEESMRREKKRDLTLIRRKTISLVLPVLVLAITASASNVTSSTPAGSTTSGPVAASATFITGNGFINITLTDLQVNPKDVGQLISGLSFTLSNGATTGTLFSSTAKQVTVNSGGTYSLGAMTGSAGWGLNNSVSGGLQLNALGFIGPAGLILGPPGAGGTYSNANASIAGNSAHNPFLFQSVQFIIDVTGVTSATTVTSATFSFGTTPGQFSVKGCMSTDPTCGLSVGSVPEPISLVLTGSGLIGLFFLRRRRA